MPTPPTADDPRHVLDQLIRQHGEDYAALSRMLGRNPAYIQQFIRRGSPRRLDEHDRAMLAAYFEVDEALLGAPPRRDEGAFAPVPRYDLGASAGGGAFDRPEQAGQRYAFDRAWLKRIGGHPGALSIIRVEGDSMAPTLLHGDEIMVDTADAAARLRDGIYALRRDDALFVKRIACDVARRSVRIISDNPGYPAEAGVPVRSLHLVGRVLWACRELS